MRTPKHQHGVDVRKLAWGRRSVDARAVAGGQMSSIWLRGPLREIYVGTSLRVGTVSTVTSASSNMSGSPVERRHLRTPARQVRENHVEGTILVYVIEEENVSSETHSIQLKLSK